MRGFRQFIEAMVYLPNFEGDGFVKLPAVFIRFGLPPVGKKGEPINSINHFYQVREKGVSVYYAWHDPKTDKYVMAGGGEQYLNTQGTIGSTRRPYLVDGTELPDSGDDGEPLLDPKTVRVIKQLDLNDLVYESDPWLTFGDQELDDNETPRWWGNDSPGEPF